MAKEPPYRVKNMMPGMIMLWHGSVATIPSGWALCDGNNGTPDLENLFVMGAGSVIPPGFTGGAASHGHNFTGDGHAHDLTEGIDIDRNGVDGYYKHTTSVSAATGSTNGASSYPPFYALCYIMKLPIP